MLTIQKSVRPFKDDTWAHIKEKTNAYWGFLEGLMEEVAFELGSGTGRYLPGRVRAGKRACLRLLRQERQGEFGNVI